MPTPFSTHPELYYKKDRRKIGVVVLARRTGLPTPQGLVTRPSFERQVHHPPTILSITISNLYHPTPTQTVVYSEFEQCRPCLRAVGPLSKLVGGVDRVLVLLMMVAQGRGVAIHRVCRHALVGLVFRELDVTSELNVVVL